MKFDLNLLSKYPFLPELKSYLKEISFDIEEIINNKDDLILQKSLEKIRNLAKGKYVVYEDKELEILTFITSLYFVSHIGSSALYKFSDFASKEFSNHIKKENPEFLIKISKIILNSNIEIFERNIEYKKKYFCKISLLSYLKYITNISGFSWKLSFKEIDKGNVLIDFQELIRILEEAYRQWLIIKGIELREIYYPKLEEYISEFSEMFKTKSLLKFEKFEYKGIDPPCMRILINELKQGKKLTHIANFSLATYFRAIGYSVEEALEMFKNLPDFNEKIARYQIEHIYGLRGGMKVYSVPSCITLRAAGLCFPESPGCDNIKHPLQYIKKIRKVGK